MIRWVLKEADDLQCWIHTERDVTDTTQLCSLVCIRDVLVPGLGEKLDFRSIRSVMFSVVADVLNPIMSAVSQLKPCTMTQSGQMFIILLFDALFYSFCSPYTHLPSVHL